MEGLILLKILSKAPLLSENTLYALCPLSRAISLFLIRNRNRSLILMSLLIISNASLEISCFDISENFLNSVLTIAKPWAAGSKRF